MSFTIPENYLYTKDHEWASIENNIATIGITEFAKDQLGEVVYVDLPKVGDKLSQQQSFGVVESVKLIYWLMKETLMSTFSAATSMVFLSWTSRLTDSPNSITSSSPACTV